MKKLILTTLFACLFAGAIFAQSSSSGKIKPGDLPGPSLRLSLGGAFPIGEFANTDAYSSTSGVAKPGGLAELAYSHPINHRNWGFTIGIRGRLNPINNKASIAALKQNYPLFRWSTGNSHWKTLSAMAGLYYDIPAGPKFDVRLEFGLGAARSWFPKDTVLGILDTAGTIAAFVQEKVSKSNAMAFTATAKVSIAYHLNARWQLFGSLDFWYLKPTFRNVTATVIYGEGQIIPGFFSVQNFYRIVSSGNTADYRQPMNTVNVSVGVAWSL